MKKEHTISPKMVVKNGVAEQHGYSTKITVAQIDGKQVQKEIYGKTVEEVRRKERILMGLSFDGEELKTRDFTVKEWVEYWLEVYKRGRIRDTTYCEYRMVMNRFCNYAGYLKMKNLNGGTVAFWVSNFSNTHASATTKSFCSLLKDLLHSAYEAKVIEQPLHKYIVSPRVEYKEKIPLHGNEIKDFIECAKQDKFADAIIVCLAQGMRISEVLGLPIRAVDFDNNLIYINQQLVRKIVDGKVVYEIENCVKNNNPGAMQMDPLSRTHLLHAVEVMKEKKKKYGPEFNPYKLLFTDGSNNYIKHQTFEDHVRKLGIDIDFGKLVPHDLRHTAATIKYNKTQSLDAVQKFLRDISKEATLGYIHDSNSNDGNESLFKEFISNSEFDELDFWRKL